MVEWFGSTGKKLEVAMDELTGAAAKLQESVTPYMQKEMQRVREASPANASFPQHAVNEAQKIAPGMEMLSSAGRWNALHQTHQNLGTLVDLGKSGVWKNSMEVVTGIRADVPRLDQLTGSEHVHKLGKAFNERAGEVSALHADRLASRAAFRSAVGSIVIGEAASLALDKAFYDNKPMSATAFGTEVMLGLGAMSVPRLGFLGRSAALVATHLGVRAWDEHKTNDKQ